MYGARQRLCKPEKGEMFEGYELMDCEEMLSKYQDKALDNSEPLLAQDK